MARKIRGSHPADMTRRQFGKVPAPAPARSPLGAPTFLFPRARRGGQKTLKIIQWSHFVPGYDKWFDGIFTKEWGAKNNTEVIVDHIAIGEINARAAAEVAAQEGARPVHVPLAAGGLREAGHRSRARSTRRSRRSTAR